MAEMGKTVVRMTGLDKKCVEKNKPAYGRCLIRDTDNKRNLDLHTVMTATGELKENGCIVKKPQNRVGPLKSEPA